MSDSAPADRPPALRRRASRPIILPAFPSRIAVEASDAANRQRRIERLIVAAAIFALAVIPGRALVAWVF